MSKYSAAQHSCFILRQVTFTISDVLIPIDFELYRDEVQPRLDAIRKISYEIENLFDPTISELNAEKSEDPRND